MKLPFLAITVSAGLLTACGGSNSTTTPPTPPVPPDPVVPEINDPQAFAGNLVKQGSTSFETYLKNGIYTALGNYNTLESAPVAVPVTAPTADSAGGNGRFSSTNTQEQGVDEADRVEYNGTHMFIATQAVWRPEAYEQPAVRILQRNDDFSMTEVERIEFDEENTNITGMYLYEQSLSVVSSGYPIMTFADIAALTLPAGSFQDAINLSIYDTSDPANSSLATDIDIEGWLIGSRRIDNDIYLISAFQPRIEGLSTPETDEQAIATYDQILDTPIENIMPKITVNGVESSLNNAEDCYFPEAAGDDDGYAQVVSVTRINVNDSSDIDSMCMSAYADISYMSTDNLYLAAYTDGGTNLHKISIGDNLDYQASGAVTGYLGGNNPQLRLSEASGYLRVVTTDWTTEDNEHKLFVLEQEGADLTLVATLPNDDQPEAIGKPGEDIYAVRFIEDKAYIVTFLRIDPLYVIDLTDNTAPVIAGELEIPGFSSYLHPMENGYLLGVGQEVNGGALPETGSVPLIEPVTPTGMKVSLFDVSDPSNPMELATVVRENSYTPVEYDYRALSVLKLDDAYRFALPMETWGSEEDEAGNRIWSTQSKLIMMDVNAASGQGSLTVTHELQAINDPEYYVGAWDDRSVIHEDNVFYLHGNSVWHSLWATDAEANGPY